MTLEEYNKIVEYAVLNEDEAYLFYRDVALKTSNKNLTSIFEDLAKEELQHKTLLKTFLSGAVKKLQFDTAKDYKVAETVEKPKLSTAMKPVDAIALAMKNEEEAMNLYKDCANLSTDAEQKDAFLNLAKMEQGHKGKLEDLYVNAAFTEVW
jgi:rubrerythrin